MYNTVQTILNSLSHLFALLAPVPSQDGVLESWDWRFQVSHVNVHGPSPMSEIPHVIHHGNATVWVGTDVRRSEIHKQQDIHVQILLSCLGAFFISSRGEKWLKYQENSASLLIMSSIQMISGGEIRF